MVCTYNVQSVRMSCMLYIHDLPRQHSVCGRARKCTQTQRQEGILELWNEVCERTNSNELWNGQMTKFMKFGANERTPTNERISELWRTVERVNEQTNERTNEEL